MIIGCQQGETLKRNIVSSSFLRNNNKKIKMKKKEEDGNKKTNKFIRKFLICLNSFFLKQVS